MHETKDNQVSKFWSEDWKPGVIKHDHQTDDASCGVHVIEVINN